MDPVEYQNLLTFVTSNYVSYPDHLSDKSTKESLNRRDRFKAKAKKYYSHDGVLHRYIPGNINGAEVVVHGRQNEILREFHGSTFGGHSGVNKTIEAIRLRYWWYGQTDDVKKYIKSCERCQKSDPLKPPQKPELQSIKVTYPFELVGVDLVGPLKETENGNKYIFTATDYFTKWVEAFPIKSKTAVEVCGCFEKLFSRHGAMNAVLTDQGREFNNELNTKLCEAWNIRHKVTAAYHPQTNGLDERTNQTLKASLRKLTNEHQTDWDTYIDGVLFSIRTKPHSSTKFSPFYLLYGREAIYPSKLPKNFGENENPPTLPSEEMIHENAENRKEGENDVHNKVIGNIKKAQAKQKSDYEKRKGRGRVFKDMCVGDKVLLHNTKKATKKSKGNLDSNYTGPYVVVSTQGKSVTLQNQNGEVLKTKVSIDRLKKFINTSEASSLPSECLNDHSEIEDRRLCNDNELETHTNNFLGEITKNGMFGQLLTELSGMSIPKVQDINMYSHLRNNCHITSFIAETSKDDGNIVEAFGTAILPHLKDLNMTLSEKASMAMIMANVCTMSAKIHQPVMSVVDTLKVWPSHLSKFETIKDVALDSNSRIFIGRESIEKVDLETLDGNNWLNDKVINAFLTMLKEEKNQGESHVFVMPSHTAVLLNNGAMNHWLFKKAKFSLFQHVVMPINVNDNHWILLFANITERRVGILDSLNGQSGQTYLQLWSEFMKIREKETGEVFGDWTEDCAMSNKQRDGSSCGVFTLMNAECIIKNVPHEVMRQVHVPKYREYVLSKFVAGGKKKKINDVCDMPSCSKKNEHQRWVQCGVCGRWFHIKCANVSAMEATRRDYDHLCIICEAAYN